MLKKIQLLILLFLGFQAVNAQLVITEIMYNPPESNTDSLEYVEIQNTTDSPINLEGYKIDGFGVTFPNMEIGPKAYVVAAGNVGAMQTLFNVVAVNAMGALKNGGEVLSIIDANDNTIFTIEYGDKDPWDSAPDGNGPSLELCADQDPSNPASWKASTTSTGVIINDKEIFGTPGTANSDCNAVPFDKKVEVSNFMFTPEDITINIGETVLFENKEGHHNINGDQSVFPDNPESFGNGQPSSELWKYTHTFNTVGLYQYQCDPHSGSMKGTITVQDPTAGNDYPVRMVGKISTTNATGVADSLGVKCTVIGIVHGVNLRPSGLQFTVIDLLNEGIGVFSNDENFGYEVKEGDVVSVQGTVEQYNGLLQIKPVNVNKIGTDNPFEPTIVTKLDESTESQIVKFENCTIIDESKWSNSGSGFNVLVTNGTDTINVRIDNDVDLYSMKVPTGTFSVTGIGSQYDSSEPYLSGYQLLPRYVQDIDPYNPGTGEDYPERSVGEMVNINSNGVADSIDAKCTLVGVVYGVNLRGSGLAFTIIDPNDKEGISIFSASDDFGYTVTEGDVVRVKGTLGQYNGLTQLYLDGLEKEGTGTLVDPTVVTTLDESTESQLVQFEGALRIVDLSQWTGDGKSFNVDVTDGTNTFTMRIDNNTELSNQQPASEYLDRVTGIGGQYDSSEPFTEGYQLFPRYSSDLSFTTATTNTEWIAFELYPNPVKEAFVVKTEDRIESIEVLDNQGQVVAKSTSKEVQVNSLAPNMYIVKVTTSNGVGICKFIKL